MLTIREESRQKFKVIFEDEDRERFTPTTARYRLDDKTNGYTTELIGWTAMTTAEAVEITIPSSANRILNDCNRYETRVLTVQSDYGTDDQLSEDETYRVMNLSGFQ
jgi:hypothetical protein